MDVWPVRMDLASTSILLRRSENRSGWSIGVLLEQHLDAFQDYGVHGQHAVEGPLESGNDALSLELRSVGLAESSS